MCVSGKIRASVHAVSINNQSIKENKTTKSYFLNGGEVTSCLSAFCSPVLRQRAGLFRSLSIDPELCASLYSITQKFKPFPPPQTFISVQSEFYEKPRRGPLGSSDLLNKKKASALLPPSFLFFCKLICTFNQSQASLT